MKICRAGAELFDAVGRTDMTKATVVFRNFANVPQSTIVESCQSFKNAALLVFFKKSCPSYNFREIIDKSVQVQG